MRVYFGQREHFYQTTAILDPNLEEAWWGVGTKMHLWLFKNLEKLKYQIEDHFTSHFLQILLTVVIIHKFRVLKKLKCSTSNIKT